MAPRLLPGLVAAMVITTVAVLYTVSVFMPVDHDDGSGIVVFVASATFLAGGFAAGGALARDPYWRRLQLGIAAAITLVLAVLTGLSIGPVFWLPLALLIFAFARG